MTNGSALFALPIAFLTSWLFMIENDDLRVSATDRTTTGASVPLLKLTTSLLTHRFCVGDSQVSMLRLRLRLRYTNVGEHPIILNKSSNVAPTVLVSRSVADTVAGNRELIYSVDFIVAEEPGFAKTQRLLSSYVVLRRGEFFDTTSEVSVPFAVDDQRAPNGTITRGEHLLQIQVVTWWESLEVQQQLSSKWKHRGYLWHEVVQSEPMPFSIDPHINLENCR